MAFQFLFGPVPSRRLGRSLGVDLVTFKTCSYNCIYCQLGPTTNLTLERRAYVPAEKVLAELRQWADDGGVADYITLSGSGEPTLSSELAAVIKGAREIAPETPLAVLTNGSLLWDERVREELAEASVVIPSLDAAREESFRAVNRPAPGLELDRIIDGLKDTQEELEAEMWLEIMLVQGVNDSDEDFGALRQALDYIEPDAVQINTVVRPPAEVGARPLGPVELLAAAESIGHAAEVIAPLPEGFEAELDMEHSAEEVLALLRRRPCTLDDIAVGLGMHRNEAAKYVSALLARQAIVPEHRGEQVYYLPA